MIPEIVSIRRETHLRLLEDHVSFGIHDSIHTTALLLLALSELLCYANLFKLALVLRQSRQSLCFCICLCCFLSSIPGKILTLFLRHGFWSGLLRLSRLRSFWIGSSLDSLPDELGAYVLGRLRELFTTQPPSSSPSASSAVPRDSTSS